MVVRVGVAPTFPAYETGSRTIPPYYLDGRFRQVRPGPAYLFNGLGKGTNEP